MIFLFLLQDASFANLSPRTAMKRTGCAFGIRHSTSDPKGLHDDCLEYTKPKYLYYEKILCLC